MVTKRGIVDRETTKMIPVQIEMTKGQVQIKNKDQGKEIKDTVRNSLEIATFVKEQVTVRKTVGQTIE